MSLTIATTAAASEYVTGINVLLLIAISILVVHGFLALAYIAARYDCREWLARIFDAQSYPAGSLLPALSEAIHARLMKRIQPPGSRIESPTRTYELRAPFAVGDLCTLHLARCGNRAYVLKVPRVSSGGRLVTKEQAVISELRRQPGHDHYAKHLPSPVESFWSRRTTVSVFQYHDGLFTARQIRQHYPAGVEGRQLAWMFNRILEALGFAHRGGWIHGAVLPAHLLFDTNDHGLQLIGWTHAVRVNEPLQIVSRDYKPWYPPESHRREPATPATDIYLAAKSMIWLAGGKPLTGELPEHVPGKLAQVFRECLSPLSTQRPNDAWTLHEQFRERLQETYGPPHFSHLSMPSMKG
jgi:serine/threonine protein kinase